MFGRSHDIDKSFESDGIFQKDDNETRDVVQELKNKITILEEVISDLKESNEFYRKGSLIDIVTPYKKDMKNFLDSPTCCVNQRLSISLWNDDYEEIKSLFTKLLEVL